MNYFGRTTIDTIKAAGTSVGNKNTLGLSNALAVLQNESVKIDNQINDLLYNMMLDTDHPLVKREQEKKLVMEQFVKGFELYYVFLTEDGNDYYAWVNRYSNFYEKNPAEIFNELMPSGEVSQSSEEYELYRGLKTVLNPKGKTPDVIPVNYDTYFTYFTDTYKVAQLKRTKKLPGPDIDTWYFFRTIEDMKSYFALYPPKQMETFLDSSREVPMSSVVVASCSVVRSVIQKLPPSIDVNIDIYAVKDIYDRFVRVDDIIDLQIGIQQKRYGKVSFRSIGTGR